MDADIHIAIRQTGEGTGVIKIGATKNLPRAALIWMMAKALESLKDQKGQPDWEIELTTQQRLRNLLKNDSGGIIN